MTGIAEYFATGLLAFMGLVIVTVLFAMVFGPVIDHFYQKYKDRPRREILYSLLKVSAAIVGFIGLVFALGYVSVEFLGAEIEQGEQALVNFLVVQ